MFRTAGWAQVYWCSVEPFDECFLLFRATSLHWNDRARSPGNSEVTSVPVSNQLCHKKFVVFSLSWSGSANQEFLFRFVSEVVQDNFNKFYLKCFVFQFSSKEFVNCLIEFQVTGHNSHFILCKAQFNKILKCDCLLWWTINTCNFRSISPSLFILFCV